MFLHWEQKRKQDKASQEGGGSERKGSSPSVSPLHYTSLPLVAQANKSLNRPQVASSLFLAHNTALVPPYRVLIDTNFINFSLQNKLELISGMMDCLFAKCRPSTVYLLTSHFQ